MSGLESDTIGGFNAMLEKQKKMKAKFIYRRFCLELYIRINWITA